MMEWQEILDHLRFKEVNNTRIDVGDLHALINAMLQKLASEEAAQEPVKDGFRLEKITSRYEFSDVDGDLCRIENHEYLENVLMIIPGNNALFLTQEMVRALLPLLNEFVEKGEIR